MQVQGTHERVSLFQNLVCIRSQLLILAMENDKFVQEMKAALHSGFFPKQSTLRHIIHALHELLKFHGVKSIGHVLFILLCIASLCGHGMKGKIKFLIRIVYQHKISSQPHIITFIRCQWPFPSFVSHSHYVWCSLQRTTDHTLQDCQDRFPHCSPDHVGQMWCTNWIF